MALLHDDRADAAARALDNKRSHLADRPIAGHNLRAALDRQLAWRDVLGDQRDVLGLELREGVDRVEWLLVRGIRADVAFLRERLQRRECVASAAQLHT